MEQQSRSCSERRVQRSGGSSQRQGRVVVGERGGCLGARDQLTRFFFKREVTSLPKVPC